MVKLSLNPTGKYANISLENVALVGAIPEAAIQDAYLYKSQYIGPVTINTDDPSAPVTMKVLFKRNNINAEAFWLNGPARLVLDVFPNYSPRAMGRQDSRRQVTSFREVSERNSGIVGFTLGKSLEPVVCYPVSSPQFANLLPQEAATTDAESSTASPSQGAPFMNQTPSPQTSPQQPPGGLPSLGTGLVPPTGNLPPGLMPQPIYGQNVPYPPAPYGQQPLPYGQQPMSPYPPPMVGQPNPAYNPTYGTMGGGGLLNMGGPMPNIGLGGALPPPGAVQRTPAGNPALQRQPKNPAAQFVPPGR